MSGVRFDVVRVCVAQRQWRLALSVLFLPSGYGIEKTSERNRATAKLRQVSVSPTDPRAEQGER